MIDTINYTTELTRLIPIGESGRFRIEKSTILKGTLMRTYHPSGYFYRDELSSDFPAVRLLEGDDRVWMSDTPMEQESLAVPSAIARGNVLIIGLGLGLLPQLLRRRRRVKKITIIEKEADVVMLVYPYIRLPKTSVVVSDAKTYIEYATAFGYQYDFIFIDVWGCIVAPIREIEEWTELVKPVVAPGGVVCCWLQELYDRIKDKLPKEPVPPTGLSAFCEPCLICGKKLRNDYAGLCMDCADELEVTELFTEKHDRK